MPTDLDIQHPYGLLFLIPAFAAVVCFALAFGKKERIMVLLMPGQTIRWKALKTIVLCAALVLMVFALSGPRAFAGFTTRSKSGLDIYLLIDCSKSMLVSDIAPDRMAIAKRIARDLLNHLDGDRIGFIPFASDAYIQMPLTDDYQLAGMFLDVIDTDMISGGGTNLAAALRLAGDSFDRSAQSDQVILILSDGEEHDGDSLEMLNRIVGERVRVYTIGIGTEKGGLVPVYNGDSIIVDYMKDAQGQPVTSRLMADTLQQLARNGRGAYYQASQQGSESETLIEAFSTLKRGIRESEQIRRFKPMYQCFLGLGILLFIVAWFLPERRKAI